MVGRKSARERLASGGHRILVTRPGYRPFEQEVEVAADADVRVDARLLSRREVTAASRTTQVVEEAPASVSILTAQEIRAFGYTSLYEALASTRGLFPSDDLSYQSIGIRGFGRPGDYGYDLALILTALGSIVLGMGLPTTAAYVVLAALGAPALIQLGVPLLAAHLFIFYFGCISNVTPPVSLAAYAAAGIAGAPPLKTAVYGMTLAGAGFIVPFMFVYGPALLLVGGWTEIVVTAATAALGVTALAAATMGFARRRMAAWQRVVLAAAAFTLLMPGLVTDLTGVVLMAVMFARGPDAAADRREAASH